MPLKLCLGAPRGSRAQVVEVATRAGRLPWTDDTLTERLMAAAAADTVVAVDAPLTQAACSRCERPVCPGHGGVRRSGGDLAAQ